MAVSFLNACAQPASSPHFSTDADLGPHALAMSCEEMPGTPTGRGLPTYGVRVIVLPFDLKRPTRGVVATTQDLAGKAATITDARTGVVVPSNLAAKGTP